MHLLVVARLTLLRDSVFKRIVSREGTGNTYAKIKYFLAAAFSAIAFFFSFIFVPDFFFDSITRNFCARKALTLSLTTCIRASSLALRRLITKKYVGLCLES